jgi:nucleotide sugar dehydrogenase
MSNVPTVGIIGGGFVGGAHADVFKHYTDVKVYDIDIAKSTHDYADVISQDVLFMCLPTPMDGDGKVNTRIIAQAMADLSDAGCSSPVILKSTVTPEKLQDLYEAFPSLNLIYSPEFLTERTAALDLQNSTRFIFGVDDDKYRHAPGNPKGEGYMAVRYLFEARFPRVAQYWISYQQASLVKYFANAFFACKISLLNEFYDIATQVGVDGQDTINLMLLDPRIGRSHHMVPGHDGKRGFGGTCFPKDLNGLINTAHNYEAEATMLQAAWEVNLRLRPKRDWEQDVGRAVSEDEDV